MRTIVLHQKDLSEKGLEKFTFSVTNNVQANIYAVSYEDAQDLFDESEEINRLQDEECELMEKIFCSGEIAPEGHPERERERLIALNLGFHPSEIK